MRRAAVVSAAFAVVVSFGCGLASAGERKVAPWNSVGGIQLPKRTVTFRTPSDELPLPPDLPATAIDITGDLRSPATYARAFRRYVEAMSGMRSPGLSRRSASSTAEPADGVARLGVPAGDLDGDDLADVVILEAPSESFFVEGDGADVATGLTLRAASGKDGHLLWSVGVGHPYDALPFRVGDLSGDGRADLLLVEYEVTYLPAPAGTLESFVWTFRLLSGKDGSELWNRPLEGYVVPIGEGQRVAGATADLQSVVVRNALGLLEVSGDHNGDGVADVILNAVDVVARDSGNRAGGKRGVPPVRIDSDETRFETRAEVLSGRDGSVVSSRTAPLGASVSLLHAAGDAVGNSAADAYWQTIRWEEPPACGRPTTDATPPCSPPVYAETIEMIDSGTGGTVWSIGLDQGYRKLEPIHDDLTGDCKQDLFYETASGGRFGVLSGASGDTAWWRKSKRTYLLRAAAGAIGGQAGSDSLLLRVEALNYRHLKFALERVDGPTGSLLFSTEHTIDWDNAEYGVIVLGSPDGTGDGVADVVIEQFDYDPAAEDVRTLTSVASGREPALEQVRLGSWELALPGADFDGDGRGDLLAVGGDYDRWELSFTALPMTVAPPFWHRADDMTEAFLFACRDTSGRGGDDLVYTRTTLADEDLSTLSRVDLLEGRSGEATWGYGSSLEGGIR